MENFFERLKGGPGLLLENSVAALRECLIEIGRTLLHELTNAGAINFIVVLAHLTAALQLASDALAFVDEKHHDVNRRLTEMDGQGSAFKGVTEALHSFHEKFQALDLNFGAGKTVEDDAIAVLSFEQFAQQQPNHFAITDHSTGVFDSACFRCVEQGADHDGIRCEAARLCDEGGVRALAGAGCAPEQD